MIETFLLVPSAQRPQEWKEIGQEETESKLAKQNSGAKRLAAKSSVSDNEPANVNYTSHISSSMQTGQITLCSTLKNLSDYLGSEILA